MPIALYDGLQRLYLVVYTWFYLLIYTSGLDWMVDTLWFGFILDDLYLVVIHLMVLLKVHTE